MERASYSDTINAVLHRGRRDRGLDDIHRLGVPLGQETTAVAIARRRRSGRIRVTVKRGQSVGRRALVCGVINGHRIILSEACYGFLVAHQIDRPLLIPSPSRGLLRRIFVSSAMNTAESLAPAVRVPTFIAFGHLTAAAP